MELVRIRLTKLLPAVVVGGVLAASVVSQVQAQSLSLSTAPASSSTPGASSGLLNYNENVGNTFTLSSNITVSALGLFSSNSTGTGFNGTAFTGTDYSTLFDMTTGTVVAQVSFSPSKSGTLVSGTADYVQLLSTPVTLVSSDEYNIAAFYSATGTDSFYDPAHYLGGGPTATPGATQDSTALVTYVGTGLYGNPGDIQNTLPENPDTGPAVRYGAATFEYAAASPVPEPSSIALLLVGTTAVTALRFRRRDGTSI